MAKAIRIVPEETGKASKDLCRVCVPCTLMAGYELFLMMLFLFQLQSFLACKYDPNCSRVRVIGAGVLGALFSGFPYVALISRSCRDYFISGVEDALGSGGKMLFWGIGITLHSVWFIIFLVFAFIPHEATAELASVATELRFRTSCSEGKLLDVSENLTYTISSGFTTTVDRVLPNQPEPHDFIAQWVGGDVDVTVDAVKRKEPEKYSMDYETGHLTTVTLKFDAHNAQQNGSSFTVNLRYAARLYGVPGACGNGGSVCYSSSDISDVKGSWEVLADKKISQSVIIKGCSGGTCDSSWVVTPGAPPATDTGWKVEFSAPSSLRIGSMNCPLAWSVGSRTIWWIATGVCTFLAAMVCFATVYAGGEAARFGIPIICCLLVLAFVFLVCALTSDFFRSEGTEGTK